MGNVSRVVILQPNIYKISSVTLLNQRDKGYVEVSNWELWNSYACAEVLSHELSKAAWTTPAAWGSNEEQEWVIQTYFTVTILHCSTFPDIWHTEHSLQFSSCKTFLSRGIWLLFFTGKLLKYSSPATDCTVELCKKITKRDSSNLEYEDRMTEENNCLVQQCLIYYCKLFFSRQSGEKKENKTPKKPIMYFHWWRCQ